MGGKPLSVLVAPEMPATPAAVATATDDSNNSAASPLNESHQKASQDTELPIADDNVDHSIGIIFLEMGINFLANKYAKIYQKPSKPLSTTDEKLMRY